MTTPPTIHPSAAKRVVTMTGTHSWAVLMLGDCRTILPELPRVDCVVTDPPYGLGIEYGNYEDTKENLVTLIEQTMPIMRDGSERVILSSGITNCFLWPSPDWIVACAWNTTGSYGKYGVNQWFPILCYGKDLDGFGAINGMIKGDLLTVNGGGSVGFQRATEEASHPCPKPLNLMVKLVARFSLRDQTVSDPMCGSGTTGVACARLQRNFIGVEICEEYFTTACRRIRAELDQGQLF